MSAEEDVPMGVTAGDGGKADEEDSTALAVRDHREVTTGSGGSGGGGSGGKVEEADSTALVRRDVAGLDSSIVRQMHNATTVAHLNAAVEATRRQLQGQPVVVALTGRSGAGKSTLNNSLRGLGETDPKAAEVNAIECTAETRNYPFPSDPSIVLQDMCGGGTLTEPKEGYWERHNLSSVDALVVVTSERSVYELDAQLLVRAQKEGIPAFYVRTRADVDHANLVRRDASWTHVQTVTELKEYALRDLAESGVTDVPVFIVSGHKHRRHLFEFQALQLALVDSLGEFKARQLVLALDNTTARFVELKKEAVRKTLLPYYVAAAAALGVNPDPVSSTLMDVALVTEMIGRISATFGVSDRMLRTTGVLSLMQAPVNGALTATRELVEISVKKGITALIKTMGARAATAKMSSELLALVPIFGSMASAGINATLMHFTGNHIVDLCARSATEVRTILARGGGST